MAVGDRRRTKVGATIDPRLAAAVDAYVEAHPGTDRSGVIDDALRLWCARQQAIAMAAQFRAPVTAPAAERQAWKAVRTVSARRRSARVGRS
ncbi:MAG TPA: hypothetical protein VIN34_01510 [Candidatus Limnocylindria bacterium]|jgi:hypothetical protein